MSRFANALKLALESDGAEEAAIDVVPAADTEGGDGAATGEELEVVSQQDDNVVVDNSGSAEEAIAESDTAEAAIDDEEAKSDELEEAAAGLESIYDQLRAAAKKGPLSQDTLKFANIAIESYGNRIGMSEQMTLSTEGRGNTVSLENIKETLANAWAALLKFFNNLWAAILNFIKRLFTASGRLKANAEKLLKVKLTDGAKNGKISLGSTAGKIAVAGKIQDPTKGTQNLIKFIKSAVQYDEKAASQAARFQEGLMKVAANGTSATVDMVESWIENDAFVAPAGWHTVGTLETAIQGKGLYWETDELPGGVKYRFFFYRPAESGKNGGHSFAKSAVKTIIFPRVSVEKVSEKLADAEVNTLSPAEIASTSKAVLGLLRVAEDTKSNLDRNAKEGTARIKKIQATFTAKGDSRLEKIADWAQSKQAVSVYKGWETAHGRMTAKLVAHAVKTAAGYLEVAIKSAAQYGKEGKKAA